MKIKNNSCLFYYTGYIYVLNIALFLYCSLDSFKWPVLRFFYVFYSNNLFVWFTIGYQFYHSPTRTTRFKTFLLPKRPVFTAGLFYLGFFSRNFVLKKAPFFVVSCFNLFYFAVIF